MTSLTSPPSGYDSMSASPAHHHGMNYPEVAVYCEEAVMPRYIIVYQHEGENYCSNCLYFYEIFTYFIYIHDLGIL